VGYPRTRRWTWDAGDAAGRCRMWHGNTTPWFGGGIGGLVYGGSLGAQVAVGGSIGGMGMAGPISVSSKGPAGSGWHSGTNGPTGRGGFDGGSESGYGGGIGGLGYGSSRRSGGRRRRSGGQGYGFFGGIGGLGLGGSLGALAAVGRPLVAWAQEAPSAQPRKARVGLHGSGVSALAVRRRGMVAISAAWALAASSGLWRQSGMPLVAWAQRPSSTHLGGLGEFCRFSDGLLDWRYWRLGYYGPFWAPEADGGDNGVPPDTAVDVGRRRCGRPLRDVMRAQVWAGRPWRIL